MEHEFYCRVRRYFRDNDYEMWSVEFDYGEGYLAEDKIVLNWNHNKPNVLWLIKLEGRLKSEEYESIVLGLFEDVSGGEGTFILKRKLDTNVEEYDVNNLIDEYTKVFG
ncbi:MAG: hypothetical protein GX236_11010 [Clostridiaceae bacterium]|jgi:hypothetical protein|nr:hypothetical protein [Clostridiaceae bacterium]